MKPGTISLKRGPAVLENRAAYPFQGLDRCGYCGLPVHDVESWHTTTVCGRLARLLARALECENWRDDDRPAEVYPYRSPLTSTVAHPRTGQHGLTSE